jgi:hypothetical protein
MAEANKNQRRYKWPWLVAAAVALGLALAIIWMTFAVRNVERERDLNAPLPGGKAHTGSHPGKDQIALALSSPMEATSF